MTDGKRGEIPPLAVKISGFNDRRSSFANGFAPRNQGLDRRVGESWVSSAIAENPLSCKGRLSISSTRSSDRAALEEATEGQEAGHADAQKGHRGRFGDGLNAEAQRRRRDCIE
jgi:hypothetical protein